MTFTYLKNHSKFIQSVIFEILKIFLAETDQLTHIETKNASCK